MRSFLSCFFLSPANTILVPGIIFFGFVKYLFSVFLSHVSPELRFADEYENPPILPASRPTIPHKLGPCPLAPPFSVLWHCAHLAWKILAPFSADMMDLSVWFVTKQMVNALTSSAVEMKVLLDLVIKIPRRKILEPIAGADAEEEPEEEQPASEREQ